MLVGGSTDAPLVDLLRHLLSFFDDPVELVTDYLSRCSELIKLPASYVHRMRLRSIVRALTRLGCRRVANLIAIATCLGSSLDVVLNLLLLLFIRISNLDSLANLGLLGSI